MNQPPEWQKKETGNEDSPSEDDLPENGQSGQTGQEENPAATDEEKTEPIADDGPLSAEMYEQQPYAPETDANESNPTENALEDELRKTKEQLLRAVAETENVRKRAERERQDATKYAVSSFAKDLLDFSDNFRRAIDSVPEELKSDDGPIKSVLEGIMAMENELLKTFEKHGIGKLTPEEEKFDPNFHEVMFEVPGSGKPGGTVVQVVEPGYTLHGRLIRPARVGVAKDEGNSPQDSGNTGPGSQIDTEA